MTGWMRRLFASLAALSPQATERKRRSAPYRALVRRLGRTAGHAEAMELASGGEFEAMGQVQLAIVQHFGLAPEYFLVDVGCGPGRLALPLSGYLRGGYLGIDVVPELIHHARDLVSRPDWQFKLVDDIVIPARDRTAHMVCFFSVFTHLRHEESYRYLLEACRVARPGGRIIFTFLDFIVPGHWQVFEESLAAHDGEPPNVFLSKETLRVWARHLGLTIIALEDAHHPYVPLPAPITFADGTVMTGRGTLGQSLCVLQTPSFESH